MNAGDGHGNLWSIVLAGGDGARTKEFIRHWLGYEKPKQYCVFVGSRSMFQHTLDRAVRLTPEELRVLEAVYDAMPRRNFSSHFLQCTPKRLAVTEMADVLWSDWGNPVRIAKTLERIGRQPAFSGEPLPFLYQG
jgi:hypothetical protein